MDSSMSKLFLIQDTTQRNLKLQPPEWKVQPNKESQLGFLQGKNKRFYKKSSILQAEAWNLSSKKAAAIYENIKYK